MRNADVLDRVLAGEQVEDATPEVLELAQLASVLQGAWQDAPTKAATDRTRAAVLSVFQENGNGQSASPAAISVARPSRGRRVVARLALAAALVLGLPAVAWAASQDSLPGQVMYPVKLAFEEARLAIAGDPVGEARMLLEMTGERVEEAIRAAALGLEREAELARRGYRETVARFEGRVVEARALGLPVEGLLEDASELFETHQQAFEAIFGPPPAPRGSGPTEVLSAGVPPEAGEAGQKGQGKEGSKKGARGDQKRGGGKDRAEGRGDRAGGGAGGGSGGHTAGSGGGKGGASGGGAQEDDDGDHDDDDSHIGRGKGKGHVKAIGNGHQKDRGKGHTRRG